MSLARAVGAWFAVVGVVGCRFDAHVAEGSVPDTVVTFAGDAGISMAQRAEPDAGPLEADPMSAGDAGVPEVAAPPPELTWPADPTVAAALLAWDARAALDGDVPSARTSWCSTYLDGLEILPAGHAQFRELCLVCDRTDPDPDCQRLGRAFACAPVRRVDGVAKAVIVLDEASAADPRLRARLVVHETIHHLGFCTHAGMDRSHGDARYWCTEGATGDCRDAATGARSVMGRAMAADTGA